MKLLIHSVDKFTLVNPAGCTPSVRHHFDSNLSKQVISEDSDCHQQPVAAIVVITYHINTNTVLIQSCHNSAPFTLERLHEYNLMPCEKLVCRPCTTDLNKCGYRAGSIKIGRTTSITKKISCTRMCLTTQAHSHAGTHTNARTHTRTNKLKVADGCALHTDRTAGTVLREGGGTFCFWRKQKPKSAAHNNNAVPFSQADYRPFIWSLIKASNLLLEPSASFTENNTFTSPR